MGPPAATWAYTGAKYRTYPLFLGAAAVMLVPPLLLLLAAAARSRRAAPPPLPAPPALAVGGKGGDTEAEWERAGAAAACVRRFPAHGFGPAEAFEAERLLDPAAAT